MKPFKPINFNILISILFLFVAQNLSAQGYCVPKLQCNPPFNNVDSVIFAGITNASSGCGYNDFTSSVSAGTINLGDSCKGKIVCSLSSWPGHLSIWIDWNNDSIFDETGIEKIINNITTPGNCINNCSIPINILPPTDAYIGNIRMRIVCAYTANPIACYTGSEWADAEDYLITIYPATSTKSFSKTNYVLTLYPNPVAGNEFSIEVTGFENETNLRLIIEDISGRKMYDQNYSRITKLNLNTDGLLQKGIYFVSICRQQTTLVKKLIVN